MFLGLDGGGTKTAGALVDRQGRLLGREMAGRSAFVGRPSDEACAVLKGVVEDDRNVEDLYVYADQDKIFYKSNDGGSDPAKMEFAVSVPLHGGVNIVNILARQDNLTTARIKLIIRRDASDGSTMPTPKKKDEAPEE